MPPPPSSKQKASNAASMNASKQGGGAGTGGGKSGSTGGGKMGAGSSQSGGVKSGSAPAKTSAPGGGSGTQKTSAPSKMGARSTQTGGGGAFGGVAKAAQSNAYSNPGMSMSPAQNAARLDAVRRGPGISPGLKFGSTPNEFSRTATSYGLANMDKLGVTDPARITASLNNLKAFSGVAYDADGLARVQKRLGYTPVGIRTNNPGNILRSGAGWEKTIPGYVGPVKSPNGLTYQSYSDPRWGLVAQNELLGRYHDMGRTTINSVVDRYAPKDKNNPGMANPNYKKSLSAATGWGPHDQLTREQVQSLGAPKTVFENSGNIFAGGPFGGTPQPTQFASSEPGSIPRPTHRPSDLRPFVPRPTPRPDTFPRGFGDIGIQRTVNPYTAPAAPVPNIRPLQSFVGGDPRAGMPPVAFPAARMQSQVMGDPRLGMSPGAFPSARMQSPVMGDPRAGMPPGAFPAARPASIFADPRVGMPTGAYPAAKPVSIVGDPRMGLPPGSYPAAPPVKDQSRLKDQSRVASTDGFVPQGIIAPQMVRPEAPGTYPAAPRMSPFGNVGQEYHQHQAPPAPWQYRNETPPAAPHMGTPASQTADAGEPTLWDSPGAYFQKKTGINPRDVQQVTTRVQEGLQEIGENIEKHGVQGVQDRVNQMTGMGLPASLTNNTGPRGGGMGDPRYIPPQFPAPVQQAAQAQPTVQELMTLLEAMKAKGATPEEIAYVQSLITPSA